MSYRGTLDAAWAQHLAPRPEGAPTVVSLFAGCGGSSLGYSMAGYRELLAVEWDRDAAATFRTNFPGTPMLEADLRELTEDAFLKAAGIRPGELDVLDGSPPCQGFSTAGNRKFGDARNSLSMEFVRLLRDLRPRAFVMENVAGMVRGKMRLIFAEITQELKASGYDVSCRMLDAKWFGVPQERRRLIWVGTRRDLGVAPAHPGARSGFMSVAEALADILPDVVGQASPFRRSDHVAAARNDMHFNAWRPGSLPSPTVTANRPPVVLIDDGRKRGWNASRPAFTIGAGRKPELHSGHVIEQWKKKDRYVGSFHSTRLEEGGPSPTQIGAHRNWHPEEARQLTDRECARLQSFPDQFRFVGGKSSVQRQVGNSVPPLMMEAVALRVRSLLAEADGRPDQAGASGGTAGDVGTPYAEREPSHVH